MTRMKTSGKRIVHSPLSFLDYLDTPPPPPQQLSPGNQLASVERKTVARSIPYVSWVPDPFPQDTWDTSNLIKISHFPFIPASAIFPPRRVRRFNFSYYSSLLPNRVPVPVYIMILRMLPQSSDFMLNHIVN